MATTAEPSRPHAVRSVRHAADGVASRLSSGLRRGLLAVAGSAAAVATTGCEVASFLDPTVLTDPRKENQLSEDGKANPIVSVILDDLDLGVTPPDAPFADARDVNAADLEVISTDYVVGPADQIRVSINDYPVPGAQFAAPFEVSSTGLINLPDVDPVSVTGLTETEIADRIEQIYEDADIFQPGAARVTVLAFTKQNQTFTMLGNAVGRPNRYIITQPNFRMLDAMALAGASTQAEIVGEYAYIIRSVEKSGEGSEQQGDDQQDRGGDAPRPGPDDPFAPQGNSDETDASLDSWDATYAQVQETGSGAFSFEPPEEPSDAFVIRVPVRELLNGQLKFNVVIRPGDTVVLDAEPIGVFYLYGNTLVTGAFSITPQNPMTLKRAIASGRGLSPVAIPQRTQLIRKMGDQDVFVRVNLKKIFAGQEPDLYVKPNDMIMVGTNFPAPFLAALRNGFRVSYGFGFLYDRNFARDRNDF
jgi:polysaccharide export outer membrane protein